MKRVKTFAGVERERERERERATILINNNKVKKLALLSIPKAGYEYENT